VTTFAQLRGKGEAIAVLKGSVLTIGLVFLYTALPVVGLPAGVLTPFPCMFYSITFGRKVGYAIVVIVASTLAVLDRSALLIYLVQCVVCSLLLPELLLRGKGAYRSVGYAVATNAMIVLLYVIMLGQLQSVDMDGQMRVLAHDAMGQVSEAYRQSGVSGSDLQGLEAVLAWTEDLLVTIYPSLFFVFLVICAGCNLLLLQRVAGFPGKTPLLVGIASFRNPDALVWLLIVSGFALLAHVAMVDRIALNLLSVLSFLYLLQGIAVILWLALRYSLPRFLMVIFFVILLIQPIFAVLVASIGLMDLWAEFRAPKKT